MGGRAVWLSLLLARVSIQPGAHTLTGAGQNHSACGSYGGKDSRSLTLRL